ncbi:MAG: DUF2914 domain-containing protein [Gammaproteobacteria bacterium]
MSDPKKIVIKINRAPKRQQETFSHSVPDQVTEWNIKRIVGAVLVVLLLIFIPYYYLSHGHQDSTEIVSGDVQDELNKEVSSDEDAPQEAYIESIGSIKEKQEEMEQDVTIVSKKPEVNKAPDKPIEISAEIPVKPLTGLSSSAPHKVAEKQIEKSIIHHKVKRALLARGISNKEPFGEIISSVKVGSDNATGVFYFTEIKDMKGRLFFHQWLREGKLVYKRPFKILGNRWRASTSKLFTKVNDGNWTVRLIDEKGRIYSEINFKVVAE